MTPFEEELKRALTRCEPPPDFTANVLARVAAQTVKHSWFRVIRGWQVAAVAAATLVIAGGAVYQQQHARMVQGEQAKEKLLVAMRIAGWKLQQAQEQVQRVEKNEVDQ